MPAQVESQAPSSNLNSLWSDHIAPAVGLSKDAVFKSPTEGFSTQVVFVHLPEGDYALRLYSRDQSSRHQGYAAAKKVLASVGASVPRTIKAGQADGTSWLLEENVLGHSFRDLLGDATHLSQAAQALAFIHSNERKRYGKTDERGGRRLSQRWKLRFQERWNKIIRLFPELDHAQDKVRPWFEKWADSYLPSSYQLLHGDYHPLNLKLTEEGKVVLLDARSPRYGFGLLEAIEAAHHFTGEEQENWSPFLDVYLECRDHGARDTYKTYRDSLHAVFHLRHADRFADLAVGGRGTIQNRRGWERNAIDSWMRFCALAGIESPTVDLDRESPFPSRRLEAV